MILDTSVVVALAAGEPSAEWIRTVLEEHANDPLRMSWVNIAETGMVLERAAPGASAQLQAAMQAIRVEPLDCDYRLLALAVDARSRFHLNFGDCFAYAHAKQAGEALLTLDADFLSTDLETVIHPKPRARR